MDISYMDEPTVSKAVYEKANRLIAEDRVEHLGGPHFKVTGDHGEYTLWVVHPHLAIGWCPCASRDLRCSHIFASAVWAIAHPEEFAEKPAPVSVGDPFK